MAYNIYLQSEADETHLDFHGYLESLVAAHQIFELVGQGDGVAYVFLESFGAVQAKDEPDFQGTESPTQWYLPVLKTVIYILEK